MAYASVISLQYALEVIVFSRRFSLSNHSIVTVEIVRKQLGSLRGVLKRLDASSKNSCRKKVIALDAEIKDLVYKIQDQVESVVYKQLALAVQSDPHQISDVEVTLNRMLRDRIIQLVEVLKEKEEEYVSELDNLNLLPAKEEKEDDDEQPPLDADADSGGSKREFKMVGYSFLMLLEVIITRLEVPRPLDVVPVVGMAGIGKTAAARELFDQPLLLSKLEIECRAWVSVGRKPRVIRKIKRDILNQLDPTASSRDAKIRERDVDHRLKGIFKAKRCLVVLDDVWDTVVWNELRYLFPDYGHGNNLVLLTTRLRHVGDEIDNSRSKIRCELKLLDKDQSWELLRQRVFKEEEEECPPQLIKAGKRIAEKCDGLPLMIISVAALLSKEEMTEEFWEEVAEKESHPIFMEAHDQLYEVLLPSYDYLPQHLKLCFLHMGVFPQYHEIPRSKLLCIWASEGSLDLTVEDPFNTHMRELVDHNVAMICQIRSIYRMNNMKTCRLHSTFWHLCRREATTIKFCRVLTRRDDAFQQLTIKGQRRLSFHNNILLAMKDVVDSVEEACASSVRSLFCYGTYHPYPVSICFRARLLNMLDASALRFYEFPEQVIQMFYLRYLALICNAALPPRISRLWNLHFLFIRSNQSIAFSGVTPYVPVEIWDMKQLLYITIEGWNLPNPPPRDGDEDGASSSSLERLQELVGVGAETCTREVLERIPNVTTLKIQIKLSPDADADDMEQVLDHLSNIHLLTKLLSLACVVSNPTLATGKGVVAPVSMFPSSLKKLLLSGTGYRWECMSIIGSLPKLEVLKLRCYAFRGPELVVRYGEFRALRHLQIEGTDVVHFEVEDRGLFRLVSFFLQNCYKIKHLLWKPDLGCPICIGLFDCSPAMAATFADEMRSRSESHSQGHHRLLLLSSWE